MEDVRLPNLLMLIDGDGKMVFYHYSIIFEVTRKDKTLLVMTPKAYTKHHTFYANDYNIASVEKYWSDTKQK